MIIPATIIARADMLIAASLVLEGRDAAVQQAERVRAQLQRVRRAALKANSDRHPGQAALRCVTKVLELTAP